MDSFTLKSTRQRYVYLFLFSLFLFGLRDITGGFLLGSHYTPFSVGKSVSALVFDETAFYAPSTHLLSSQGILYADDVKENQARTLPMPIVHSILLSPFIKLFGIEASWAVARSLFPAITFCLLFCILGTAVQNFAWRIFLSLFCITFPFGPRNMTLTTDFSLLQPVEITRFPNPGLSYCLLLIFLVVLVRFLTDGRRSVGILAGILLGLMPYAYYFYAVALAFGLAVFWLALALQKETALLRRLSLVIAVSAFIAVPYVLIIGHAHSYLAQSFYSRLGVHSREIEWRGALLALTVIPVVLFAVRRRLPFRPQGIYIVLFLCLVAGGGFGLNLQLLNSYNAQHEHYWNRLIQPMSTLIVAFLLVHFLERGKLSSRSAFVAWIGIVFISILVGYRQISSIKQTSDQHDRRASNYQVLEWIKQNTPPTSSIGSTDKYQIAMIPTVTGRFNFAPYGIRTSLTPEEILNRYFSIAKIEGQTWHDIEANWKEFDPLRCWIITTYDLLGIPTPPIPELVNSAHSYWNVLKPESFLQTVQLDFIVSKKPNCENPSCRDLVYENTDWRVFRRTQRQGTH